MSERRAIPDWPEYEIDRNGRVFRVAANFGTRPGKELKWTVMNIGYAKVSLCRNSKRREYLVHRLVAMTFIGPIQDGMEVCHEDGTRLNNCVENLRIDTRKGNSADTIRHGRSPRGTRCGSNKYPQSLIVQIRNDLSDGVKATSISKDLQIPLSTVYGIGNRQTWGWL